jgi:hypothetical protein
MESGVTGDGEQHGQGYFSISSFSSLADSNESNYIWFSSVGPFIL